MDRYATVGISCICGSIRYFRQDTRTKEYGVFR